MTSVSLFPQSSPIPTSLPDPLTASEVAAKKSMTKARYDFYMLAITRPLRVKPALPSKL